MTLRLLSVQIVKFWDIIKYAIAQVEKIGDEVALEVYNKLFSALLADKCQCFIVFNSDETVKAVCITEIREDNFTLNRSLHIRCLYSFRPATNEEWAEEFNNIRSLAKSENCNLITFETSNPRIKSMAKDVGAIEVSTNLKVEV